MQKFKPIPLFLLILVFIFINNCQGPNKEHQNEIESFHKKMVKQIKRLGKFFEKYDQTKIDKIVSKGKKYKDLEEKYRIEHIKRSDVESDKTKNSVIYQELMDMFKETSILIDLIAERLSELETD